MTADTPEAKTASYIFNLQAEMGQGVQMALSGNLYSSQSKVEKNAVLDEAYSFVTRLRTRSLIPVIEARILDRQRALEAAHKDVERIARDISLREAEIREGASGARERHLKQQIEKYQAGAEAAKEVERRTQEELDEAKERLAKAQAETGDTSKKE